MTIIENCAIAFVVLFGIYVFLQVLNLKKKVSLTISPGIVTVTPGTRNMIERIAGKGLTIVTSDVPLNPV
jgi:hypothetical protein